MQFNTLVLVLTSKIDTGQKESALIYLDLFVSEAYAVLDVF